MSIKVALVLSVILQFSAAIIAITLIKRTRTNIAWWLISIGFLLMAVRRVFEILPFYEPRNEVTANLISNWVAILISLIMLLSLIFIRRIFNIQEQIEDLRKQNEARVLSAILKTEERERKHFARELHNGLGPLLSSVKMALSTMQQSDMDRSRITGHAEQLIDESISTLKDISNKLSPHVLDNFGLHQAVMNFIDKLKSSTDPLVNFNSNLGTRRFSFNVEVVVYRVLSELITNTIKHARAKQIDIALLTEGSFLILDYSDDGVGFDEEMVRKELIGFGYSNIKSRIKSLDGTFEIITEPGAGMHIHSKIKIDTDG
jgi:signal transduction histidine kinase